jgi:ribosomal protein L40E
MTNDTNKHLECRNCGATLPPGSTICDQCGSLSIGEAVKRKAEPEKELVVEIVRQPSQKREPKLSRENRPSQPKRETVSSVNQPPDSVSGLVGLFIIGALLAYASYRLIITYNEVWYVLLGITGPLSVIWMLFSLQKILPRFKGFFWLIFGILSCVATVLIIISKQKMELTIPLFFYMIVIIFIVLTLKLLTGAITRLREAEEEIDDEELKKYLEK